MSAESIFTLFAVANKQNTEMALVLASDALDAIAACAEDGFTWAERGCNVRRVHRHVVGERGLIDAFTIQAGFGNSHNNVKAFDDKGRERAA